MIDHGKNRFSRSLPLALLLAAAGLVAAVSLAPPVGEASPVRQSDPVASAYLPLVGMRLRVEWMPRVPTALPLPSETIPPSATAPPTETLLPSPTPTATPSPTPEKYSEPLTDFPSLDDLRGRYTQARAYDTIVEVLRRRYPTGHFIVTNLDDSKRQAEFWARRDMGSWQDLMQVLQHVVHEMNHQYGIQEGWLPSFGQKHTYAIRHDHVVTVTEHQTFPRSEIAQYVTGSLDNMYKRTYLSGDSGKQGFNNLIDELNAYTHSLFTAHSVHDEFPRGRSATYRDGLVTFMMYTQFYLKHGREHHPDDYAQLHDDQEMRALVKLLWERANFILDVTEDIPGLKMDPDAVEAEMRKAGMQEEIERFVAP